MPDDQNNNQDPVQPTVPSFTQVDSSSETPSIIPTVEETPSTPSFDIPPVITPPEKPKKKFGGGKIIATILGILVLVGGIGAGVILVKQQQNYRSRAAGLADGKSCTWTSQCSYPSGCYGGKCGPRPATGTTTTTTGTTTTTTGTTTTTCSSKTSLTACDATSGCAWYICSGKCYPRGTSNCAAGCTSYCSTTTTTGSTLPLCATGLSCKLTSQPTGSTRCHDGSNNTSPYCCPSGQTISSDNKCTTTSTATSTTCTAGKTEQINCTNGTNKCPGYYYRKCDTTGKWSDWTVYCMDIADDCIPTGKEDYPLCGSGLYCSYDMEISGASPCFQTVYSHIVARCCPLGQTIKDNKCSGTGGTGGTTTGGGTTTTPPTGPTAQCLNIKAYDTNWVELSASQLSLFKAGDKVRFTVKGSAASGSFDKARFAINGAAAVESTTKKPGTEEFYYEYTIPAGTTSFTINAQVHHTSLGWI